MINARPSFGTDENLKPVNTPPHRSSSTSKVTTPSSAGLTPLTKVSKKPSSFVKSSIAASKVVEDVPEKPNDWQIAIQQAAAYKKYKAKARGVAGKGGGSANVNSRTSGADLTPNSKEKKDKEAQEAYRKWKKEQEREALRNHVKGKVRRRRGLCYFIVPPPANSNRSPQLPHDQPPTATRTEG
jgi:hypothetical protein